MNDPQHREKVDFLQTNTVESTKTKYGISEASSIG